MHASTPHFIFDTGPYRRSHMKEPRGRGSWAFQLRDGEPWFAPVGTYREAKLAAKAHFAQQTTARVAVLEVLP